MATTVTYVDEKNQPLDLAVAAAGGIAQTRILRRVVAPNGTRWWLWAVKGAPITPAMLMQYAQETNVVPPTSGGGDTPTPGTYIRVPSTLPATGEILAWDATQMRPYGIQRSTLKGDPGTAGTNGSDGRDGRDGVDGQTPTLMVDGTVLAVHYGNTQTATPLMDMTALKGDPGGNGTDGQPGRPGRDGQDGRNGIDGRSAYDLAVNAGFTGTLTDWLTSLRGEPGANGAPSTIPGPAGKDGKDGAPSTVPGPTGPRGASFTTGIGDPIAPGNDQDSYLNALTGTIAQYIGGQWHVIPGVNLRGPEGPRGVPGETGPAATIDAVTAVSGDTARVVNTGTPTAARLTFTLPKGDPGTPGTPGTAATIRVGNVTTGSAGSNAAVTNAGTENAAVLDFTIPRGQEGPTGSAATVRVGQVFSGASAAVTNSGTSSAAVLDFTLPKGDKGDRGDTGTPGAGYTQRGNWTSGTTYTTGDVVSYNGSSYVARQSTATVNTQNPAAAGITYWQVLAQKGDTGTNGTNGVNGTSATVAVNSVKTGTTPNVVNVGTPNNVLLDFTLPAANPVAYAAVTTSETTISNNYAPLSTAGPTTSIVCGPQGILVITLSANASQNGRMSAKIEQGSTVVFAASDAFCLWSGGGPFQGSRTRTWTGLTPGATYTITALYNAPLLGNATFAQREITATTR